jgi:hypothetical protein
VEYIRTSTLMTFGIIYCEFINKEKNEYYLQVLRVQSVIKFNQNDSIYLGEQCMQRMTHEVGAEKK